MNKSISIKTIILWSVIAAVFAISNVSFYTFGKNLGYEDAKEKIEKDCKNTMTQQGKECEQLILAMVTECEMKYAKKLCF